MVRAATCRQNGEEFCSMKSAKDFNFINSKGLGCIRFVTCSTILANNFRKFSTIFILRTREESVSVKFQEVFDTFLK